MAPTKVAAIVYIVGLLAGVSVMQLSLQVPSDVSMGSTPNQMTAASRRQMYRGLPLSFEPNQGQASEGVQYVARGNGFRLSFLQNRITLALQGDTPDVLDLQWLRADPKASVSREQPQPGKANYILGNNPEEWKTEIPLYSRIVYRQLYPGIDIAYYGSRGNLEYDLTIGPGADWRQVQLEITGNDGAQLDAAGDVVLRVRGKEVRLHTPSVYQDLGGEKVEVASHLRLQGNHTISFELSGYDPTQPVIIDPVLTYSSYLGGGGNDSGTSLAVGGDGSIYVTGVTGSNDFPVTPGAFQTERTFDWEVFVTKLNPSGSSLVYSTYIGGGMSDISTGIVVDAEGDAFVAGWTSSPGFPTTAGAFDTVCGSDGTCNGFQADGFVTKLNPTGSGLVYSTYLGGETVDQISAIAIDPAGDAFVWGATASSGFPTTPGVFRETHPEPGVSVAFATKLDSTGSSLAYSTFLGSGLAFGGAIDTAGNAYVGGTTSSANYPTTPGAFQPGIRTGGDCVDVCTDGFVTKLNANATSLVYSTYLGGKEIEWEKSLAIDNAGNAYVTGFTNSADFPTTPGAFQPVLAAPNDLFVTKLNQTGTGLVYSTYLGGSQTEQDPQITLDPDGNAYVLGDSTSNDFPVFDPIQASCASCLLGIDSGLADLVLTELNSSGSALLFSTFLGGSDADGSGALALDSHGNVYITGGTLSLDFPVVSAYQPSHTFGHQFDVLLTKISLVAPDFAITATELVPKTIRAGQISTATVTADAVGSFNDSVSVTCSVQPSPAHAPQCSVSPGSITPGNLATVTVTTTAPIAAETVPLGNASPLLHALWLPMAGLTLAGILFRSPRERKARLPSVLLGSMLTAGVVFQTACGGGNSPGGGGSGGTPSGSYTMTVTGTSGSLTHSTTLTLTVQ